MYCDLLTIGPWVPPPPLRNADVLNGWSLNQNSNFPFFRVFDDGKTCWHGSGIYEDCNNVLWTRNLYIRYKGNNCKWWHFYPSETYADLRSKFQEIINGKAENQIVHDLIKEAKDFQIEKLGREIF